MGMGGKRQVCIWYHLEVRFNGYIQAAMASPGQATAGDLTQLLRQRGVDVMMSETACKQALKTRG
jgi:hypothetical protein